jgi:hypothetical protein
VQQKPDEHLHFEMIYLKVCAFGNVPSDDVSEGRIMSLLTSGNSYCF